VSGTQTLLRERRCARDGLFSNGGCSTPQDMENEHHDTDDQQDVNDAAGNVKGEKSKQPENDENRSD
jgi:hypothetical protein